MNIALVKLAATRGFGAAKFFLMKRSPEILLGFGIAGSVTSTFLACKATLKVNEVRQETKENFEKIDAARKTGLTMSGESYSEEDYKKDMITASVQSVAKLVKLYGPAVVLGVVSISMIVGSHGILTRRNAALASAYKILDEGFRRYRRRVIQELGPEQDSFFRFGVPEKKVIKRIVDPNDPNKMIEVEESDPNMPPCMKVGDESIYARFFNEDSPAWRHDRTFNLHFLKVAEKNMNDLLYLQGHVFLNEVYDKLGIPRSKEGAIVGWLDKAHGGINGFIDFGIYNPVNGINEDYINGYENRAILLDFNVDGPIYDMI